MTTLYILPAAPVFVENGEYWIDEKMYQGIIYNIQKWPDKVVVLFREAVGGILFKKIKINKNTFNFACYENFPDLSFVEKNSIILASADDYKQLVLIKNFPELTGSLIYVIENTFKTRIQFLLAERRGLKRLLGGIFFVCKNELALVRAIKKSRGLQANGYGAFKKYAPHNGNTILYYDTRLKIENIKGARNERNFNRIRLAYSGRLTAIKGSNYLIPLAIELKKLAVKFDFFIYGDGDLKDSIEGEIERHDLQNNVHLIGSVDYESVLIEKIRDETDLFIMPHIQGDPSCTYFETLSLGVPIIGFKNEAWSGILENFGAVGWMVDKGDIFSIANIIKKLSNDRVALKYKTEFVKACTAGVNFESQFNKRIQHLMDSLN